MAPIPSVPPSLAAATLQMLSPVPVPGHKREIQIHPFAMKVVRGTEYPGIAPIPNVPALLEAATLQALSPVPVQAGS